MQIQLKQITKAYRRRPVLKGASLTAQGGQRIGIVGSNGSGKSTLLSILAGVLPPDAGQFLCDGTDLLAGRRARSSLVGYVPQGTPLLEELTARDNLLLWYSRKELDAALKSGVLSLLGIGEFLNKPVSSLSGGMKKRLSIGCAMAKRPPILLLDEPTAALDLACKQHIHDYLLRYTAAGGLVLLTSHDAQELAQCDALYILKDGILRQWEWNGDVKALVEQL